MNQTLGETLARANILQQQGQPAEARRLYLDILAAEPRQFDALNMLGVLAGQAGDPASAARYFEQATESQPGNPAAHCNLGLALKQLRSWDAALRSFDRAIALDGGNAVAHYGRAEILQIQGDFDEALAGFERATAINPGFASAFFAKAILQQGMKRWDEAIADYDRAIGARPDYFEAHANRAALMHQLRRLDEALAGYDRAIAARPGDALVHVLRGNVLKDLNRPQAALASYDQAIRIRGDYAEAWGNRGLVLQGLGRLDDAIASHDRALALKPDYADGFFNRGSALRAAKRFEAAVLDFTRAYELNPDMPFVTAARLEARLQVCDWTDLATDVARISTALQNGTMAAHPFALLCMIDSPALQKQAAIHWVRANCPPDHSLGPILRRPREPRIRVGYFSADYHEHPTSRLLAELIEVHDRARFEVIGFSFGPDTGDAMRTRISQAFDRFIDVRGLSDAAVAALARSLRLDIAVDLGGHTHGSRMNVFAQRAAPLQISYLGYPGTTGSSYFEYLVADATLVPHGGQAHFTEKIIQLPHSYQVNDTRRAMADSPVRREELGLPHGGVVFCCFNNNYKILPHTFECWMRILSRVPGSVLWLLEDNAASSRALAREAAARGIGAGRLVFCPRLPQPAHLARHRAADLFLDTLPCNAHTTASDALWMGLPVITCLGQSFPARVAASLLNAIDLPELITTTAEAYEELAVELALDPSRLAALKQTLSVHRRTKPLFNLRLFARHLEAAYATIHERHLSDLAPDHIAIPLDRTA